MWDVLFYDETQQRAYRLQTKRLTVGDGVALDSLQDEIAGRESLTGRALISFANNYPLMRYGTAQVEVAALSLAPDRDEDDNPLIPDEAIWQTAELTEAAYWDLDEVLLYLWLEAVVKRNPHRDPLLDLLKKNVIQEWRARLNDAPTSASESGDAA